VSLEYEIEAYGVETVAVTAGFDVVKFAVVLVRNSQDLSFL
jgi:hypothetical protein